MSNLLIHCAVVTEVGSHKNTSAESPVVFCETLVGASVYFIHHSTYWPNHFIPLLKSFFDFFLIPSGMSVATTI